MMKKDNYIAIFSAFIPPHVGGIERYVDILSSKFIENNIKPILITFKIDDSENFERKNGLIIIRLPIFNLFKNRYPIPKKNKIYKSLLNKLNEFNIKAIIVNTRFHLSSHIGSKYGYKHNIPVYLIEHGSNYVTLNNKIIDFFANRYEDYLTRKIKKYIKGWYGVSETSGKWLENFKIKYDGVWYNSIDCNQKLPKKEPQDSVTFLYAGRLIKQKGVENILISFSKILENYSNVKLYIAGDGIDLPIYKEKYTNKKIIFTGKLTYKELIKYYAKTDVFLYPPLWPEGLPSSILEAGLMNCSVIATNQGGIKEIIKNEKNGIIVDGTTKSLYEAMEKLILNSELRNLYAKKLNETIKNRFSWDVTVKKIIRDINI